MTFNKTLQINSEEYKERQFHSCEGVDFGEAGHFHKKYSRGRCILNDTGTYFAFTG